ETPWLLRVRSTPDGAASVGAALARQEETSWVMLTSGGTEITCLARAKTGDRGGALLLERLPRTPRVVDVTAHSLLHVFFGQDRSPLTKSGTLTEAEIQALTPEYGRRPDTPAIGYTLDAGDRRLLGVLARDGRARLEELARATGWSAST